jgi:hypothetical protein
MDITTLGMLAEIRSIADKKGLWSRPLLPEDDPCLLIGTEELHVRVTVVGEAYHVRFGPYGSASFNIGPAATVNWIKACLQLPLKKPEAL